MKSKKKNLTAFNYVRTQMKVEYMSSSSSSFLVCFAQKKGFEYVVS